MDKPYESLRGTGRTTRMLLEVLKVALTGREVIVAGWRDHHCVYMLHQFTDLPEVNKCVHSVNFTRREVTVGTGKVRFLSISQHPDFNEHNRLFRGPHYRTPTFLDHHTVEMLEERERARAADARRATRVAETGETPESRYKRRENITHSRLLSPFVASDTPLADEGTSQAVSCDVSQDASSSSGGSEGSSGPCGAD